MSGTTSRPSSHEQGSYPPSIDNLLGYLHAHYQAAVDAGLIQLKQSFLREYRNARFPSTTLHSYLNQLGYLLGNAKPIGDILGLTAKQVKQFRSEAHLLLPDYQLETLLQRRNPAKLRERKQGPFFETEAYLLFLEWLEKGEYDDPLDVELVDGHSQVNNTPIRWLGTNPVAELSLMFRELGDFIQDNSFEAFYLHITEANQPLLIWNGSQVLLMYLFDKLRRARLFPPFSQKGLAETIAQHFLNRNGKSFKPKSLEASYSKLVSPPKEYRRIDSLVAQLIR